MKSIKSVERFINRIVDSRESLGGGKARIDSKVVRKIVAGDPESASIAVKNYCQTKNFQMALLIAGAYQVEFADDTLMELVKQAMEKAGEKGLAGLQIDDSRSNTKPPLRILEVMPKDLKECNVYNFVRLFSVEKLNPPEKAKLLRGQCAITFPIDDDPREAIEIPPVRNFIRKLNQHLPYFPYYLTPAKELSLYYLYFGCLADESSLIKGKGLMVTNEGVVIQVLNCLQSLEHFCSEISEDTYSVFNDILSIYPDDMREEIIENLRRR